MRCLALVQAWHRRGGRAYFAQAETTSPLEERLTREGVSLSRLAVHPGTIADAERTIDLARTHGAAWVVIDGYQFGADYQRILKQAGLRVLLLDDYGHADSYCADLVLNQNLCADPSLYRERAPGTRLLLGAAYALLRGEFQAWQHWEREVPPVAAKVIVTLGGSDPENVTEKVVEALFRLSGLESLIVIGGSNPHLTSLQAAVTGRSAAVQLVTDAPDVPKLMAWADIAVAAGGSTSWELAFMGLPSLVLVLADNQMSIAAATHRERLSINLGDHAKVDAERMAEAIGSLASDFERRREMSRRGRQIMDGLGADRVARLLVEGNLPDDFPLEREHRFRQTSVSSAASCL